jgi:glucose/arabinose dehydrogenase
VVAHLLLAVLALQGDVEDACWRRDTIPTPDGVVLEVSGLAVTAQGRVLAATRRGEVWWIDGALAERGQGARFTKFAEGLQEPLGLHFEDGWIWFVQRGELSRMRDVDGDDRVDEIETICDAWRVGGNYHEYNFGPTPGPDGNLWITTNRAFGATPFGMHDWRGFALSIGRDGSMTPVASGLRSPAGVATAPWGDVFFTDNQGEWCGASKLAQITLGSFHGHPYGIESTRRPEYAWGFPGDPPEGVLMPRVSETIPSFALPAVWFPYDKTGRSPSGMAWDLTEGRFGPFAGQLFVGDQYGALVNRVVLERVGDVWQGAVIPFRRDLDCGVVRVAFAPDGSLLLGETSRGWGSTGARTEGLERLVWTGKTPFEMHTVSARRDGFEIVFTKPVDSAAVDAATITLESYTYELHEAYGSDEMDRAEPPITAATLSDDGLRMRLTVDGLREGYVHELHLPSLRSRDGETLLHAVAWYTLVRRSDD